MRYLLFLAAWTWCSSASAEVLARWDFNDDSPILYDPFYKSTRFLPDEVLPELAGTMPLGGFPLVTASTPGVFPPATWEIVDGSYRVTTATMGNGANWTVLMRSLPGTMFAIESVTLTMILPRTGSFTIDDDQNILCPADSAGCTNPDRQTTRGLRAGAVSVARYSLATDAQFFNDFHAIGLSPSVSGGPATIDYLSLVIEGTYVPTPEPATWLLAVVGVACVLFRRRFALCRAT